uniref:Uncharacterized protein n=1 Tax=Solanum tuberosum TaxID=4113 RepID=M1DG50_SOLTU
MIDQRLADSSTDAPVRTKAGNRTELAEQDQFYQYQNRSSLTGGITETGFTETFRKFQPGPIATGLDRYRNRVQPVCHNHMALWKNKNDDGATSDSEVTGTVASKFGGPHIAKEHASDISNYLTPRPRRSNLR